MDEFTEVMERSKDDNLSKTIVGSEVRYIIKAARDARARVAELEEAVALAGRVLYAAERMRKVQNLQRETPCQETTEMVATVRYNHQVAVEMAIENDTIYVAFKAAKKGNE